MADRVKVPRLLSRSATMWLSGGAAVVGVVGVAVWAAITQPLTNQLFGLAALVVLVGLLGYLIGRRPWLDTATGAVGRDVWGLMARQTSWAAAERVAFRSNHGGAAMLEVRGADQRTSIYLPLVAVDIGGDRSQDPAFLRLLADQVERWAPARASVVQALRGQADHLAAGGGVRESPLALRYLARVR